MYCDWRNFAEWPKCPTEDISHSPATKQEDPLEKKGIVGAFCRVYSIKEAMDKFIPDIYIPAGENSYTYSKGSTTGGAIVYDNKYLYSHHATDPACDTLCNAFDLVRIHLFSKLDESAKEETPTHKLPSFTKMKELAIADATVNMQMRTEKAAEVYEDFADVGTVAQSEDPSIKPTTAADNIKAVTAWMAMLKVDGNNAYVKSYENVLIALENDPQLKGRFYMNTFTKRPMAIAPLPWGNRKSESTPFEWTDADDDGLLIYIEKLLGIRTKTIVTSALNECWAQHPFHPVKDYLSHLIWDGTPRIETIFQRFLGAEDTEYTKKVAILMFVAAVARIMEPGVKYDNVVVFVGVQGIGKSAFTKILAHNPEWYTDNLGNLADRAAVEVIQGAWIVEMGELSSLKRTEIETVKAFISRSSDRVRMAYGKHAETYRRSCIFIGTTNNTDFITDETGARRFYPIDCSVNEIKEDLFTALPPIVDQLWAEAYYIYNSSYKNGKKPLILPPNLAESVAISHLKHRYQSDKEVAIIDFVEKKMVENWYQLSIKEHIEYWNHYETDPRPKIERSRICAAEVLTECFPERTYGYPNCLPEKDLKSVNRVLKNLPEWEPAVAFLFGKDYGKRRGFTRRKKR